MARIRSVHPQQWTDDQFVTCSPLARLLALAIRNEADDNGVFEWNPVKLKMRCLPADNCDVAALLDELVASQQVHRYQVAGKPYGLIRSFGRFQSPKSPTFVYPVPAEIPEGYALNKSYSGISSEPLPNHFGSPGEIGPQREGRGGERREEEKTSCAEQAPAPEVEITFPLVGEGEYHVTTSQSAEWGRLFPAVDVRQELREMRAWLQANPKKRKTGSGIPRFVTSWLSKEQEKAPPPKPSKPAWMENIL